MKKKKVNIRYKRLVPISIFRFAHHLHKSRFDLKVRSSAERKEKKIAIQVYLLSFVQS